MITIPTRTFLSAAATIAACSLTVQLSWAAPGTPGIGTSPGTSPGETQGPSETPDPTCSFALPNAHGAQGALAAMALIGATLLRRRK